MMEKQSKRRFQLITYSDRGVRKRVSGCEMRIIERYTCALADQCAKTCVRSRVTDVRIARTIVSNRRDSSRLNTRVVAALRCTRTHGQLTRVNYPRGGPPALCRRVQ